MGLRILGYALLFGLYMAPGAVCWSQDNNTRRSFLKTSSAGLIGSLASLTGSVEQAVAYPRRDVGDEGRSGLTAAMNEQAYKTNNRLEASGFKVDTVEEQKAIISDAMASFSYDSQTNTKKQGYRTNSSFVKNTSESKSK